MKIRVYTYAKCDTCRKALRFLEEKGIEAEVVPIRERPPSLTELRTMRGHLGGELRRLFNTSGQDYKAMNLKDRLSELSEAEALELLSTHGNLVKRPFALSASGGIVGFKAEDWAAFLGLPA